MKPSINKTDKQINQQKPTMPKPTPVLVFERILFYDALYDTMPETAVDAIFLQTAEAVLNVIRDGEEGYWQQLIKSGRFKAREIKGTAITE
jgi:hypothetical protein